MKFHSKDFTESLHQRPELSWIYNLESLVGFIGLKKKFLGKNWLRKIPRREVHDCCKPPYTRLVLDIADINHEHFSENADRSTSSSNAWAHASVSLLREWIFRSFLLEHSCGCRGTSHWMQFSTITTLPCFLLDSTRPALKLYREGKGRLKLWLSQKIMSDCWMK